MNTLIIQLLYKVRWNSRLLGRTHGSVGFFLLVFLADYFPALSATTGFAWCNIKATFPVTNYFSHSGCNLFCLLHFSSQGASRL